MGQVVFEISRKWGGGNAEALSIRLLCMVCVSDAVWEQLTLAFIRNLVLRFLITLLPFSTSSVLKVGSGSDHTTVYFRLGVPSVYFEYFYDKVRLLHQTFKEFEISLELNREYCWPSLT